MCAVGVLLGSIKQQASQASVINFSSFKLLKAVIKLFLISLLRINFKEFQEHEYKPPYAVETAYKVAICPRGNLLYKQIYLITDLKLL